MSQEKTSFIQQSFQGRRRPKQREAVRRAIGELSPRELRSFGIEAIYFNLLSVLGQERTPQEIREMAQTCLRRKLWDSWDFLARIEEARSEGHVFFPKAPQGLDAQKLSAAAEEGQGLLVCSFHFGPFRRPTLHVGRQLDDSALLLDAHSVGQIGEALEVAEGTDQTPDYQLINAEDRRVGIKLVRHLSRGGTVIAFLDGDSGWAQSSSALSEIEFMGHQVAVRNGLARLAARMGVPLVPLVQLFDEEDGGGPIIMGDPVTPPGPLKGGEQKEFAVEALKHAYGFLASRIRRHPDHWVGCSFLHRWRSRVGAASTSAPPREEHLRESMGEVRDWLRQGRTLRVDPRRFALFHSQDGFLWADVETLRTIQLPGQSASWMERLQPDSAGLDAWDLDSAGPERQTALASLALLHSRKALIASRP